MDGYTVEEAASVLGVPRERVWELLARGVLSGSTDLAGAMRVRLKVEAPVEAPIPAPEPSREPAAAELTPFRELLTEFRSLTERYGQALLALGEARGEVATLRSRVELLEARVDLRLAPVAEPIRAGWDAPVAPTETDGPAVPEEDGGEPLTDETDGTPHALEAADEGQPGAEADAGRDEPIAAVAAAAPAEGASVELERGEAATAHAAADAVAVGDASDLEALRPSEATDDAGAATPDGDAAPADAEPHARADAEPDGDALAQQRRPRDGRRATERFADALARADDPSPPELPGAAETAAALAALRQTRSEGRPDAEADDAGLPREGPTAEQMPVADEDDEAARDVPAREEPVARRANLPGPEPRVPSGAGGGTEDHEPTWDPDVYSAEIEEPGWIVADEVAAAPTGWHPPREEPLQRPAPSPARDAPTHAPSAEGVSDGPRAARDEDEGGGEAAEPWPWGPTTQSAGAEEPEWPRSRQLDEGLAALDALAHPADGPVQPQSASPPREPSPWAARTEPGGMAPRTTQPWTRTTPPPPLAARSPASRAYRRLRRIFPT